MSLSRRVTWLALVGLLLGGTSPRAAAQAPADPNVSAGAPAPAPAPAATPPGAVPTTTVAVPPPAAAGAVTSEAVHAMLTASTARDGVVCTLATVYRLGDRLCLACGASGVWVAQVNPDGSLVLSHRLAFVAGVRRLFDHNTQLWAELDNGTAQPIDPALIAAPSSPTPAPAFAPAAPPAWTAPPHPGIWPAPPPEVLPPRVAHAEIFFMARPFIGLETLAGGVLLEGSIGYRFEGLARVWATVQPLLLASGPEGGRFAATALLSASYDTRSVELGLGVGGQTVNVIGDEGVDTNGQPIEPGSGLTLAPFLRVGRMDRLYATIRTDIVLFHQSFDLSHATARLYVPLRSEEGVWMIAGLAYGTTGYGMGEAGLRSRVKGDGGSGTLMIDGTIGGIWALRTRLCSDDTTGYKHCTSEYSGPGLGLGVTWIP